jgi:integrase
MSALDVRIHAIRRRPDRRRPFEVRWHADGRTRSRSFITRGLAEGYRAELIRAARKGLHFSAGTGEPASWATPEAATISWLEHAAAYAAMKWPLAAAHTRAGIADALATITPALFTPGRAGPPAAVLRAALYGHAFNPARASTDPGPPATAALGWARHHCLPLTALADPAVTRRALEALALRLDGTRAAATTITRKRAVFHGCLSYAAELGLLEANPLDRIIWQPPRSSCSAGPRSAATPAEVQAILTEVTQIRPELTAFFGCLYYAAQRPAEAVALRASSCVIPSRGWGQLTLTGSLPRSARAWTGQRHATRTAQPQIPPGRRRQDGPDPPSACPPPALALVGFRVRRRWAAVPGARGGPLSESLYGRVWYQARAAANPGHAGTQAASRPYDLRHAALSLWLASGAPPAEIAARAGHSVRVLLTVYAHGMPGCDQIASQQIEQALRPSQWPPAGPRKSAQAPGIPSVMRPCHSWTQRDTAGPETSAQIRLHVCDLRKYRPMRSVPLIAAPDGRSRAPVLHKPLTRPDLAHTWPTATGNGYRTAPGHVSDPASGYTGTGSDLAFCVAGVGFEPT